MTRAASPTVPRWFVEPSLGARLGGAVIDALVTAPVLLTVFLLLPSPGASVVSFSLRALYEVVLVARNGQTIGKAVVGTRVVMLRDRSVPSVGSASVRWFVAGGFAFLGRAAGPLAPLAGLLGALVLVPILQPPLHRGLHDRAAGTVVTRA